MEAQTTGSPERLDIDPAFLGRLARMGGDQLVVQLIQMYLTRSVELVEAIISGAHDRIYEQVQKAAHSLISSAGNLGGNRVSDICRQIEKAAMEEQFSTLSRLEPDLHHAQAMFIDYLRKDLETR